MDADAKWSCSQCTYLNYSRSIRCTMCGISKSSHIILEDGVDQLGNRDIYQPSPVLLPTRVSPSDSERWSCPMCTFSNKAGLSSCIQCHTSKDYSLPTQLSALRINTNQNTARTGNAIKSLTPSPPSASKQINIDAGKINSSQNSPSSIICTDQMEQSPSNHNYKWRCRGCTYENWPRGSQCTMCGTPKGSLPLISPPPPPARLATPPPPSSNVKIKDKEISNSEICSIKSISESTCESLKESSPEKRPVDINTESINERNNSLTLSLAISNIINQSSNTLALSSDGANNRISSNPSQNVLALAPNTSSQNLLRSEGAVAPLNNYDAERILRHLRRRLREADWAWLNACVGVVEGTYEPVQAYLASGGDPMRQLTASDVKLLARPSAFDEGHTLVHLAIRFDKEDLLATILSHMDGGGSGVKRVPAYVAPDLAADIRKHLAASMRQRKGVLSCHFFTEIVTFSLPADIEELPSNIQEQLFEELLDRDAQKQLEEDSPIINWSLEITDRLGSRLYALWNRTAGDCLLDSLLQAAWGVFDRDGILRRALADSLSDCAQLFYPRWRDHERSHARLLNYFVSEGQILDEWAELMCLAARPGAALEQLHIFVLSHIFRRPIIVYGVKCVKSFRGEDLGFARFEGVYLPLLWEPSFCWKSPLALGYTRGHFSALVPMQPEVLDSMGAGAIIDSGDPQVVFLPLMTHDEKLLPVHFLPQAQIGFEEEVMRSWLEVCVSEGGILVAQQHLAKLPLAVAQMTQEWINHYRRIAQLEVAPFSRPVSTQGYSSDGDSEEE